MQTLTGGYAPLFRKWWGGLAAFLLDSLDLDGFDRHFDPTTHISLLILGIVIVFVVVHLEFHEEALHREKRLVQTRGGGLFRKWRYCEPMTFRAE